MVKRALCVMLIGSLKFSEPTDVDVLEELMGGCQGVGCNYPSKAFGLAGAAGSIVLDTL